MKHKNSKKFVAFHKLFFIYFLLYFTFISDFSLFLFLHFFPSLPIMQGANFGFLVPFLALFSLPKWQCPYKKGKSQFIFFFLCMCEKMLRKNNAFYVLQLHAK